VGRVNTTTAINSQKEIEMRHGSTETHIHLRHVEQTPRDLLINILEEEGDDMGWGEEDLIREAAMRLEADPETSLRMARSALRGLVRDGLVYRDGQLICLKD
jgi:hypothetical protein